jgi:hypothetical protein
VFISRVLPAIEQLPLTLEKFGDFVHGSLRSIAPENVQQIKCVLGRDVPCRQCPRHMRTGARGFHAATGAAGESVWNSLPDRWLIQPVDRAGVSHQPEPIPTSA